MNGLNWMSNAVKKTKNNSLIGKDVLWGERLLNHNTGRIDDYLLSGHVVEEKDGGKNLIIERKILHVVSIDKIKKIK